MTHRFLLSAALITGVLFSARDSSAVSVLHKESMIWLIATPSTKVLHEGQSFAELRVLPRGGILAGFQFGLLSRLSIGFSYGGSGYFNYNGTEWNIYPGFLVKYALCIESRRSPSVVLGLNTQGWCDYMNNPRSGHRRYFIKAPGFYIATGKVFELKQCCGKFAVSTGMNFSLFENEDDKGFDLFFNLYKPLWRALYFSVEYQMGLNDNESKSFGKKLGYLNSVIGYRVAETFAIEFGALDYLVNNRYSGTETRFMRLIYVSR